MTSPDLRGEIKQLNETVTGYSNNLEKLSISNRRHRTWILMTVIGLFLDLCLTGVIIYQQQRQVCTNNRAKQFYGFEKIKVTGQVAGLVELRANLGDPVKGTEGMDKFIAASEGYLKNIHKLPSC